jgi:hypothetical protein
MHGIAFDFLGFTFANANGNSASSGTLIANCVVPGRNARRIIFRGNHLRDQKFGISLHALAIQHAANGADASGPDILQQVSAADL